MLSMGSLHVCHPLCAPWLPTCDCSVLAACLLPLCCGNSGVQYASRLQEQLAKPGTSGGGRSTNGSTPGSSGPPTQQQLLQQASSQQQQQQQQRSQQQSPQPLHQQHGQQPGSSTASSPAAAPAAAPAVTPPRATTPGTGEGERSMAGRVLLLGRWQARRVSNPSSRSPPGGSSSNVFSGESKAAGCGVPRSLAPNEVEDLSRLATASKVAPIRTQGSITPQLWDVVFGAARSPPAAGSRRALHHQQQQQAAEAFTSNAALPRIKTRPLGEAREQQLQQCSAQPCGSCGSIGITHCRCSCYVGGIAPAVAQGSSQQRLLRRGSRWLSCLWQQPSSPGSPSDVGPAVAAAAASAAAVAAAAAHEAAELHHQQWQSHHISSRSSCRSFPPARAGPLAEGLDRTGSLLNRTSSVASSAAARLGSASNSSNLARAASISRQQQAQGHVPAPLADGGGSGNFGASLARRASAAGEAVSRTLEADREGLLAGCICDDASAEAAAGEAAPGRRL
jgi:hypothetical protein